MQPSVQEPQVHEGASYYGMVSLFVTELRHDAANCVGGIQRAQRLFVHAGESFGMPWAIKPFDHSPSGQCLLLAPKGTDGEQAAQRRDPVDTRYVERLARGLTGRDRYVLSVNTKIGTELSEGVDQMPIGVADVDAAVDLACLAREAVLEKYMTLPIEKPGDPGGFGFQSLHTG
jgi:hypothetical protein